MVGRKLYAPAAFNPGEILDTHFQRLSRLQDTWFCRGGPRKKSPVTPPEIDPGTVRLVAQRLNHYAIPGPTQIVTNKYIPHFLLYFYNTSCDHLGSHNAKKNLCNLPSVFFEGLKMTQ